MAKLGQSGGDANQAADDWTVGWDAHPMTLSQPRWTMGGTVGEGKEQRPRTSSMYHSGKIPNKNPGFRDTYLDKISRGAGWVPGPGTHKIERMWEQPKYEQHVHVNGVPIDRVVPTRFSKATRSTSLTDLRKIKTTLLPTSYLTPGPGAYTAFSTFGSPSGPSRTRYFAANKNDNYGTARAVEKFHRHSERF